MQTARLQLQLARLEHADSLWQTLIANRTFLAPYLPSKPQDYTHSGVKTELAEYEMYAHWDKAYRYFLFTQDELIGEVSFNSVVRSFFQNAHLGYWLSKDKNGKGYMQEALDLLIPYAFFHLHFHRIEAATLTTNHRSMAVLRKQGFRHEGMAKNYLHIAGRWQDHHLFARTNDRNTPSMPAFEQAHQ